MKLSIVIICWNDRKVIHDCLSSIYAAEAPFDFETIVSDNGSSDDSIAVIRRDFSQVRIVANRENLGFARGNNAGIRVATGEYVLILNPDTIIRGRALETLVEYADAHPEAGAFGARVLNPDGTFQNCARPLPTVRGYLIAALCLRWLGMLSEKLTSDVYPRWDGRTEREIGYQSGCCVMLRKELLATVEGFDDSFFYHFEETDLCCRVWKAGRTIRFCPAAEITHLGGQSVKRSPLKFALETYRSRYRYFYKHFGVQGVRQIRWVSLLNLGLRWIGYTVLANLTRQTKHAERAKSDQVLLTWNWKIDPLRFVREGFEPDLGFPGLTPMAPAASAS